MKRNEDMDGTTAVCVGAPNNAKRAALFFKSIWHLAPFGLAPSVLFPESFNYDRLIRDRVRDLFWEFVHLTIKHPHLREFLEPLLNSQDFWKEIESHNHEYINVVYRTYEDAYLENVDGFRDRFLQLLSSLSPIHPTPVIANARVFENHNASIADINVTLSNLQIVDVTNTSWEQIVEFRKDVESAKALRRLRVFLYETCKDQSRAYIEDKILSDLQAYDDAVKSHGFKLITGSLTTLLDSQSIIAASGAIVAGTLVGGPLVGLGSGIAIEVGKLAIEISKTFYSMRELKRDHSLAYIIKAREELTK